MIPANHIDELRQLITRRRLSGSQAARPPHWFYLEGFAAALDEPFEIREAKARLHFYQHVPIEIHPGEYIVGQIDWNEPFISYVSNTHILSWTSSPPVPAIRW